MQAEQQVFLALSEAAPPCGNQMASECILSAGSGVVSREGILDVKVLLHADDGDPGGQVLEVEEVGH